MNTFDFNPLVLSECELDSPNFHNLWRDFDFQNTHIANKKKQKCVFAFLDLGKFWNFFNGGGGKLFAIFKNLIEIAVSGVF